MLNRIGRGLSPLATQNTPLATTSFDFQSRTTLPVGINFTRNSAGSVFDSTGSYTLLSSNNPRFNYHALNQEPRGLLIEASASNLIPYASDYTQALWTKSGTTIDTQTMISPDGVTSAHKIIETASTGSHRMNVGVIVTPNQSHTLSIFVKKGTRDFIQLALIHSGHAVRQWFNIETKTLGSSQTTANAVKQSASIQELNDGWIRLSLTGQADSTDSVAGTVSGFIYHCSADGSNGHTGSISDYFYAWGAQLEAGDLSSLIHTSGTSLSRASDQAELLNQGFLNANQGSVTCSFTLNQTNLENNDGNRILSLSNDSGQEFAFYHENGALKVTAPGFDITGPTIIDGTSMTFTVAYDATSAQLYHGTNLVGSDTSIGSLPLFDDIRFGSSEIVVNKELNGHLESVRFYADKLTADDLVEILQP